MWKTLYREVEAFVIGISAYVVWDKMSQCLVFSRKLPGLENTGVGDIEWGSNFREVSPHYIIPEARKKGLGSSYKAGTPQALLAVSCSWKHKCKYKFLWMPKKPVCWCWGTSVFFCFGTALFLVFLFINYATNTKENIPIVLVKAIHDKLAYRAI